MAQNGALTGSTPLTVIGLNFGYGLDATATATLIGAGDAQ